MDSDEPEEPIREKPRFGLISLALAALVIFITMSVFVWDKLKQDVWVYYTDDAGTRVGIEENKTRNVLWQDPKQNVFIEQVDPLAPEELDPVNQDGKRLEATFSPNGTTMVLVRQDNDETGMDLYVSLWNGRVWSPPEELKALNSEANERGPAFSRDGEYLYFASDREDGKGGYDIYVAHSQGDSWSEVDSVGGAVNTASNELGPAPSNDGKRLFFSSDRAGKSDDIFVAERIPPAASLEPGEPDDPSPEEQPDKPEEGLLASLPQFSAAIAVSDLNSKGEDVQVALTRRGDHVFLASDRDRDGDSGFGLYISRVVDGKELRPEKVDLYIDGGDATDPAVRMEGFDLLFSGKLISGEETETNEANEGYRLYRSTTREVFGYTDLSRWDQFKNLLRKIIWWILLGLFALAALIYILEHWSDLTSLYHKCLAGSAALHLIILLLLMIWMVSKELTSGGEPQSPEIAISIDALAQEELALESTPEEAQVSETPIALVTDRLESDFKIPVLEAQEYTKTSPIVTSTSKTSLVSDIRPSKANTETADEPVTKPEKITQLLTSLPETFLPELEEPVLDERAAGEPQKAVERANPEADIFRPTEAVPQVETEKSEKVAEISNTASEATTEAEQIEPGDAAAETKDTGGDVVVAHRGLEAIGELPDFDGKGTLASISLNLPGEDPETDPLLPGELQTPKDTLDPVALTNLLRKQRDKPSLEVIEQLGGSDATERAIAAALEWLSRNQEADGHWDTKKHEGGGNYDTASAGLALLCYYGWGISHNKPGKFQGNAKKAIDWLVSQQKEDGDLRGGGRMYCHGIAAIALCEAYGVSKDPKLKEPAEKAIKLILASQDPNKGGWRYNPTPGDSDTSVTGWQYMALHSARMAGIEVDESVFVNARRWFDHAGGGRHGGLYGYTGPEKNKHAMIATGMFCRQLDLVPPTDPRMPESAQALKMRPINVKKPDLYYLYYGTLALYQHQGPIWVDWNERIKETLTTLQKKTGPQSGSWDKSAAHAASGGRVVSTALATLSLEVYYRLLPMYGFRNKDAAAPALRVKGK
ncbi:MAG: hypothetical protein HOL08_13485 [Opitutae bacterium]|nr:hypothetical protein [Opitutae bacterium]